MTTYSLAVLSNPAPSTSDLSYAAGPDEVYNTALYLHNHTWKQLEVLTGGLSAPSKMPCHSFSISAKRCNVGSKLRKVAGSTCNKCYALKGRYVFPNVERAMERRLAAMYASPNEWAAAIVASIWKKGEKHFRWHDSGDLQGMNHLRTIVAIAEELDQVQFWLPTREYGIVRDYLREFKAFPPNLTVRVSAPMIGQVASEWEHSSSVDAVHTPLTAWADCVAPKQGNKCMDCRACWDQNVEVVNYKKH
jgi:hypothetical protein